MDKRDLNIEGKIDFNTLRFDTDMRENAYGFAKGHLSGRIDVKNGKIIDKLLATTFFAEKD